MQSIQIELHKQNQSKTNPDTQQSQKNLYKRKRDLSKGKSQGKSASKYGKQFSTLQNGNTESSVRNQSKNTLNNNASNKPPLNNNESNKKIKRNANKSQGMRNRESITNK